MYDIIISAITALLIIIGLVSGVALVQWAAMEITIIKIILISVMVISAFAFFGLIWVIIYSKIKERKDIKNL